MLVVVIKSIEIASAAGAFADFAASELAAASDIRQRARNLCSRSEIEMDDKVTTLGEQVLRWEGVHLVTHAGSWCRRGDSDAGRKRICVIDRGTKRRADAEQGRCARADIRWRTERRESAGGCWRKQAYRHAREWSGCAYSAAH